MKRTGDYYEDFKEEEAGEKEDYMLFEIEEDNSTKEMNYTRKRIRKVNEALKKGLVKSKLALQLEQLDNAQSKKIEPDNKGFQILAKMGFKEGSSLGRGTQRIEPISVVLKNDRTGLGNAGTGSMSFVSVSQRKIVEDSLEIRKARFQTAMNGRYSIQLLERDVENARRICMDLDEKNGRAKSALWPAILAQESSIHLPPGREDYSNFVVDNCIEEAENAFENLASEEKMEILTKYVRSQFYFCQWCGIEFNDVDDMDTNCPGDDRRDHDDD